MNRSIYITDKYNDIKAEIKSTRLIAVTKYASLEDAKILYDAGQFELGEARVGQLQERAQEFYASSMEKVNWHFIGNLQTNKINRLLKIPNLHSIHSVSSKKLLESIYARIDLFEGKKLHYFIQIKTSKESEKNGIENYDELSMIVNFILANPHPKLHFQGLMTMGAIRTENFVDDAKYSFEKLAKIRKKIISEYSVPYDFLLSMGMSGDYKLAIDAGSDIVRVGSALFPEIKN
jgi:PLP dependent protein